MAIAKIERVTFIATKDLKKEALRLLQAFQRIEIYHEQVTEDAGCPILSSEDTQWREALQELEKAQVILSSREKTSSFEKLRTGRRTLSLGSLEQAAESGKWKEICRKTITMEDTLQKNRSRRIELLRLMEQWALWEALSVHPHEFLQMKYSAGKIGIVPSQKENSFLEQFRQTLNHCCFAETVMKQDEKSGLFFMYSRKDAGIVQKLMEQFEVIPVEYPYESLPGVMLKRWREEELTILSEEQDILNSLSQLAGQKEQLDLAEEYFRNLLIREEAKKYLPESKTSFLLNGWIASQDKRTLKSLLKKNLRGPYYLAFAEIPPEEYGDTPVVLDNGSLVSAFETLTEMYSMPSYDEIDPTPVMTPFYLVFFGMMVADVGYGLILLAATFAGRRFLKPDKGLKKNLDFFYYLSFPVIVWGVIYGSFFGMSLPFHLFSPTTDIIPILIQSVIFGWIQLMTGLSLSVYIHLKKKDALGAVSDGLSWIGLLLGLMLMILSQLVLKSQVLFTAAVVICGISVLLIVIVPVIQSKKKPIKGLLKGLYALYGATGYIGDLVSYTRLMALGVAGGSIAIAFNTIIASMPLPARLTFGVLLALVLHGLNLFLSLLGAYVHGIRLQYVELFSKFYGGGGRKFSPFKAVEKNVYILNEVENKNEEDTSCQ